MIKLYRPLLLLSLRFFPFAPTSRADAGSAAITAPSPTDSSFTLQAVLEQQPKNGAQGCRKHAIE
jgi:hypothetical protein